jgi:hypothetical protein
MQPCRDCRLDTEHNEVCVIVVTIDQVLLLAPQLRMQLVLSTFICLLSSHSPVAKTCFPMLSLSISLALSHHFHHFLVFQLDAVKPEVVESNDVHPISTLYVCVDLHPVFPPPYFHLLNSFTFTLLSWIWSRT